MTEIFIKGLHGCSCHSFASWAELNKMERQRFAVGENVKHRCSGEIGTIKKVDEPKYWVIVVFPSGNKSGLMHVSNLIKQ